MEPLGALVVIEGERGRLFSQSINREPYAATSDPVTATSDPVMATSDPVMVTSDPVMATSDPVMATSDPVMVTSDPVMVTSDPVIQLLKVFGDEVLSPAELRKRMGISHRTYFRKHYLNPALGLQFIELIIPDKPNSKNQAYRITQKGKEVLRVSIDVKKA